MTRDTSWQASNTPTGARQGAYLALTTLLLHAGALAVTDGPEGLLRRLDGGAQHQVSTVPCPCTPPAGAFNCVQVALLQDFADIETERFANRRLTSARPHDRHVHTRSEQRCTPPTERPALGHTALYPCGIAYQQPLAKVGVEIQACTTYFRGVASSYCKLAPFC